MASIERTAYPRFKRTPTAQDFITGLRSRLAETAQQVDAAYPENGQLVIEKNGQLHLKKLQATEPRVSERTGSRCLQPSPRASHH